MLYLCLYLPIFVCLLSDCLRLKKQRMHTHTHKQNQTKLTQLLRPSFVRSLQAVTRPSSLQGPAA